MMRYADAISRRLRIDSTVTLRCTTHLETRVLMKSSSCAYIQYLTQVLQVYAGAYSSLSTRVPIVPALVASPLPGPVHSITISLIILLSMIPEDSDANEKSRMMRSSGIRS